MRAGNLCNRVIIQQTTESRDSSTGSVINTWGTFATVWAAVEPISGREYFSSQQVNSEITARIRIRYLPGVTSKMRISYDSRLFDIQSVIDIDEQHRELHFMCKEVPR